MKNIILFTLLFFAFFAAFGQKSALHYEIIEAKKSNLHFENIVLNEVSADRNALNNFIKPEEVSFFGNIDFDVRNDEIKAMNLVLPCKNKTMIFELVEVPEYFYEYKVVTEDGVIRNPNRNIKHYRGLLKDDYNSLVAITIYKNEIMGLVCTDEGNFNIGKDSLSGKHIFYNEDNVKEKIYPTCNTQYNLSLLEEYLYKIWEFT